MAAESHRKTRINGAGTEGSRGWSSPSRVVWVGSLNVAVTEAELAQVFSQIGRMESCKIMRDDNGASRGFAYITFHSENDAEQAAGIFNGFSFHGHTIKTKGPSALRLEGHTPRIPTASNYRPFTDCSFFMLGNHCKKGKNCPYRHSERARESDRTCSNWKEKKCLDLTCPFRHPGNKEPVPGARVEELVCGGRCGVPKCGSSFSSKEALDHHVEESQLLKCPYCSSLFRSESEYMQHLQKCFNDQSSSSTADDDGQFSKTTDSRDQYNFSSESDDGTTTSRQRSHSGSEASGWNSQRRESSRSSSTSSALDPRQHSGGGGGGVGGSSTGFGVGTGYSVSTGDLDLAELEYLYDNKDDDDDSDDDDDDDVVYSTAEMARLLSLNERDMQEDEEDEDVGGDREREELTVDAEWGLSKRNNGQTNQSAATAAKSQKRKGSPSAEKRNKKPSSSPGHSKTKEPVGMFWDIENCSVPVDKSAFVVASKLRKEFIAGKREAEFMCVCDITKERKEVTDDLNKAQVTLVHVNAIAKNAADDKLRQSLRRFANTYPPPATVVLISGDVNFSAELNDLTNCHNLTVVLVHNTQASDALKVFASRLVNYDHFIADVQPPSKPQNPSDLPRVVAVGGLPKHVPQGQIFNRLGRLSENCGGKVIRVDMSTGTAKILFRTNELAVKAQKRMNNEDVFGHKISTSVQMEPNPPTRAPGGQGNFQQLAGPSLGKTFPPPPQRPPGNQIPGPAHRTPPVPARHNVVPVQSPGKPPQHVPRPLLPTHPYQRAVMSGGQPRQGGQPYPRMHPNAPPQGMMRGGGLIRPPGVPFDPRMVQPPGRIHQNQLPLRQQPPPRPPHMVRGPPPAIPMMANSQWPRFKQPPCANIKDLPMGPIPRHEGRILVFKIPPPQESHMEHNVLALQQDAFFSAQHKILWHSYLEIQVLFKLDFIQTAAIRKEEIIQALYEKGNLPVKVAEEFVETCTKSIADVLRRHNSQWEVTMCGWTCEEEENRIVRSNALTILRSRHPLTWINFTEFKHLYQQRYGSAISELSIHTACAGAVQILSNSSNKGQVVVIHEFSPLVKILSDPKFHEKLRLDISQFLSTMPQRRVKLLDFVHVFQSKLGQLPTSPSGKILQDILTSTPNVEVEGSEPANTYVILKHPMVPPSSHENNKKPKDLSKLKANFLQLLKSKGSSGIPTKCFQQDYQTFFHQSFRISDYLGTEGNMQDLFNQMPEVKVASVRKEKRVFLAGQDISPSPSPSPPMPSPRGLYQNQQAGIVTPGHATASVPAHPTPQKSTPTTGNAVKPLEEVNGKFRKLLTASTGRMQPYAGFQQQYQSFFHVSFKPSLYGSGMKMRELMEKCPGIQIITLNGEDFVCLAEEVQKIKSRYKSSGQIPVSKSGSTTPVKATAMGAARSSENLAAEGPTQANISQFRNHCVRVLTAVEGKCLLAQFPENYLKVIGTKFQPSYYAAKKLLQLLEAVPDCVQVYNDNREMKLIDEVSGKKKCEAQLVELVYAQEGHKLSIDRLMSVFEAKYGHKLEFHGHSRLLKLLESFSDTLKILGSGSTRPVTLTPLQLFSCEMAELFPLYHAPMPINKVVPSYKEHFKKDLSTSTYGFSKLIKLLEAVPDVLQVKGSGATRTVSLISPHCTPLLSGSPEAPPDQQHVLDGILALLLNTNLQKLSVIELTKKYNATFGRGLDQWNEKDMINVVEKSPNFKTVGAGPLMYVHVVQGGSSPKSSPAKATDESTQKEGVATPAGQAFPMSPKVGRSQNLQGSGPRQTLTAGGEMGGMVSNAEPGASALKWAAADKELLYKDMPELVNDVGVADSSDTESTCSSSSSWLEDGDEAKRMVNETRRLLLAHQEHAMTLAELVESFRTQEDPSNVSVQNLYQYLSNEATAKKFKVSSFPGSLGNSMIQLVSSDCLWKLGEDLLQLFVFRPTHDLCHPISALPSLYQECFSKKLITAVYSAQDIEQVLRSKVLKKVIHVDSATKTCSPCEAFKVQVVASLLVELLFYRGNDCTTEGRVPTAYHVYFGARLPLDALGLTNVSELFRLPKVQQWIQSNPAKKKKMKPVLKMRTLFTEQIRQLLTKTNGRFALYQFASLYSAEFGVPVSDEISTFLKKGKLPRYSMNIANYSGLKWAVWAPNAYRVPSHRQEMVREKSVLPVLDPVADVNVSQGDMDFSTIQKEASDIINCINSSLDDIEILSEESSSGLTSETLPTPTPSESDLGSAFASSSRLVLQSSSSSSELLKPVGIKDRNEPEEKSEDDDDDSRMLATAYGFLKDDPELLARLSEKPEGTMAAVIDTTAMPEEDVKVLTEVLDLQRLHHSGLSGRASDGNTPLGSSSKTRIEELSSGRVPVPPGAYSGAVGTGSLASGCELPLLVGSGPVDFLEQGLGPDQVLDQLQKLKEVSGGTLKPNQMTPFFDYFGELSSRELDRIEKLEAQANPHKKAGNGEVRKKKRNMAIRFPSQSNPAALSPGKELSLSDFSVPVGKLPVANFDDLSSDESGGEVKPFSREEFIREALRKDGREKDIADLLGSSCGGDGQSVTDSLLDTADLNTLSRLDSARSDLESFLRQERDL